MTEKIKCNWCEKIIEAVTMNQADYNYKQHILAKHPDKITIEDPQEKN